MGTIANLASMRAPYAPLGLQEAGCGQSSETPTDVAFADLLAGLAEAGGAQDADTVPSSGVALAFKLRHTDVGEADEATLPSETDIPLVTVVSPAGSILVAPGQLKASPVEFPELDNGEAPAVVIEVSTPAVVLCPMPVQLQVFGPDGSTQVRNASTWNPLLLADSAPSRAAAPLQSDFKADADALTQSGTDALQTSTPEGRLLLEPAARASKEFVPAIGPVPDHAIEASVADMEAGLEIPATEIASTPAAPEIAVLPRTMAGSATSLSLQTPLQFAGQKPSATTSLASNGLPLETEDPAILTPAPECVTDDSTLRTGGVPSAKVNGSPIAVVADQALAPSAGRQLTPLDHEVSAKPESAIPPPLRQPGTQPGASEAFPGSDGQADPLDEPPPVPEAEDRPASQPACFPPVPPLAPLQVVPATAKEVDTEPSGRRGNSVSVIPAAERKSAANVMAQVLGLSGQMPRSMDPLATVSEFPPNQPAADSAQLKAQARVVEAGTHDRGEIAFSVRMQPAGNTMAAPGISDTPLAVTPATARTVEGPDAAAVEGIAPVAPREELGRAPELTNEGGELPAAQSAEATEAGPEAKRGKRESREHRAGVEVAPETTAQAAPRAHSHALASTAPKLETVPARPTTAEPIESRTAATMEPDAKPEAPKGAAVRDVKFEVTGNDQRVEVRLSERAGEVKLTVRTPDGPLAGTLRENLPELNARLAESGIKSETWHPAPSLNGEARSTSETAQSGNPRDGEQQPRQQDRESQDGEPRRHRNSPEPTVPKQRGKDFAWLMSSLR